MSWPRGGHVVKQKTVELQLPWRTVITLDKKGKFIPAGPWALLGDYSKVRAWGELAGTTGNIRVTPAIQLTTDPRKQGVVVSASTTFEKEGVFDPGEYVKIPRGKKKATYVRVGWLASSPSGELVAAAAQGTIELSAED